MFTRAIRANAVSEPRAVVFPAAGDAMPMASLVLLAIAMRTKNDDSPALRLGTWSAVMMDFLVTLASGEEFDECRQSVVLQF